MTPPQPIESEELTALRHSMAQMHLLLAALTLRTGRLRFSHAELEKVAVERYTLRAREVGTDTVLEVEILPRTAPGPRPTPTILDASRRAH
ncbi:MAG: hypothetical protein IT379_23655 [Deltaproteobacteria bacterium]|nr:hypothetical protein [Deltaproteobacteria bacterium]